VDVPLDVGGGADALDVRLVASSVVVAAAAARLPGSAENLLDHVDFVVEQQALSFKLILDSSLSLSRKTLRKPSKTLLRGGFLKKSFF